MKIVQVIEYGDGLVGLADDGQLYSLTHKDLGFGLIKPTWELYCTEYGPALTTSVIEQIATYITSHCYTSTVISEKLKERYGNGATVTKVSDTKLEMLSNDRRITVTVEACKVAVENDEQLTSRNGLKITTATLHGDMHMQTLVNKSGGAYVRC